MDSFFIKKLELKKINHFFKKKREILVLEQTSCTFQLPPKVCHHFANVWRNYYYYYYYYYYDDVFEGRILA
jgi:hypothetical protein